MGQVLGAALLFGAVGLIAKSLVQPAGPEGDPLAAHEPRPRRRDPHRAPRRLHRRPHVGRQRGLLRPYFARRLPAAGPQGRRNRHLSRGRAPVRCGCRALGGRKRGLRNPVLAPPWLHPGCPDRRPPDALDSRNNGCACSSQAFSGSQGSNWSNVPFAGTIVVVMLSAGAVVLLVWLARHSWIRFVRGRGAAAPSPAE